MGYRLDDCVERGKPSYIGMRDSDVRGYLAHEMPLVRRLANRMGYHFVLGKITYPYQVQAGKQFDVQLEALNKGVAYQFAPCFVAFALLNQDGEVVEKAWANAINTHHWAPDQVVRQQSSLSFGKARKGVYTLAIGCFGSKGDEAPLYRLGIGGRTADNWYKLQKIEVN